MEFELLPDLTELYSKNSLRRNSGHPATSKQTLSTRFSAVIVLGVILEKQADASKREEKNMSEMSSIATKALTFQTMHAWLNDHQIDFENAKVIDKGNYRVRKTLKSWHTAMTNEADNNSRPLPRQYAILSN